MQARCRIARLSGNSNWTKCNSALSDRSIGLRVKALAGCSCQLPVGSSTKNEKKAPKALLSLLGSRSKY